MVDGDFNRVIITARKKLYEADVSGGHPLMVRAGTCLFEHEARLRLRVITAFSSFKHQLPPSNDVLYQSRGEVGGR
jgi:hypothetical protein